MRKVYNEFFYIPKHGKIREKVMLARVATIIAIMIMCLAAMSITAYAYFSYSVTSAFNTIQAANFDAEILITKSNNETVPVTKDKLTNTAVLTEGTYSIKLSYPEDDGSAKTGFCIVTIGDTIKCHTQQLGVDGEDTTPSVTFTLLVANETKVTILSHWGTSSYYADENARSNPQYIKDGDIIDLTAAAVGNDGTPSTKTTKPSKTTTPETTGTSEPTATNPSSSTTDSATNQSAQLTETTSTDLTESAETQTSATEQTQPTEDTTGAPTTEASE